MTATSIFQVGQRLTDFVGVDVMVAQVGQGGFGEVAMGPDQAHDGRWSAIKRLRPDFLANESRAAQERLQAGFLREALTWKGLWPHPNLLTAQYVAEINGQPMLVIDYAEQGSLRDLFETLRQRRTWLRLATALTLAQHIASGLLALHTPTPGLLRDMPIVHRDLKPENILLDAGRIPKITDFGLAKAFAEATLEPLTDPQTCAQTPQATPPHSQQALQTTLQEAQQAIVAGRQTQAYRTQRGVALGTPAYMAPEQWLDALSVGPAADLYAFGVVLVELITSRHPLLDLRQPHSLVAWREAHQHGGLLQLQQLGAEWFAAEAVAQHTTADQRSAAGLSAALVRVEKLVGQLLAKQPDARPDAGLALRELQQAALELGLEDPYTPPTTSFSIHQRTSRDSGGTGRMPTSALGRQRKRC